MAKVSEIYFGKTRSWLFQRLHGYKVHGKQAEFSESERKKLSDALLDLGENIKSVAMKIA
jgi:hypothetical protein